MKKILILALFISSWSVFAQEFTKFRIDAKQKATLLRSGDADVITLESYLDGNNSSLKTVKYPGVPTVTDVTSYIQRIKDKSLQNKSYKGICVECYEAEYRHQLMRLEQHGLTAHFGTEVMSMLLPQDSVSMLKTCELIVAEAKRKWSYHSTKINRKQGECLVKFYDESAKSAEHEDYLSFLVSLTNDGNSDLEIEGEDFYSLAMVKGKFLDFAGFWIKYINPHITLNELAKNGDKQTYMYGGEKRDVRLIKIDEPNKWMLRNY